MINKPITQWTGEDIVFVIKSIDKKTWVKIGIAAVIFLIFTVLVFWPAWITRSKIKREMKVLQGQISTLDTLAIKKPQWLRNKESYTAFIDEAKERLYQADELSLLLGHVSKMALESNVKIVSSRPKNFEGTFPKPFDTQYEAAMFEFTIEGGYHDLATFVSEIESNPKLLRVQWYQVRPDTENPGSHFADITLTAVAFMRGTDVSPT